MSNNVSKQILLSVIGVAILVIAVIGVSFAFFIENKMSVIESGSGTLVSVTNTADGSNGSIVTLSNSSPVSSEVGKTLDLQSGKFAVKGKTETSIKYVIKAITVPSTTQFRNSEVFAYIKSDDVDGITFTANGLYGTTGEALGADEVILGSGTLTSKDEKVRNFAVYFWVDDSVVSVGENGTYTEEEFNNLNYSVKIKVEIVK